MKAMRRFNSVQFKFIYIASFTINIVSRRFRETPANHQKQRKKEKKILFNRKKGDKMQTFHLYVDKSEDRTC